MSRLWQCGFEWQSVTAGIEYPTQNGTAILETTVKHSGSASYEVSGAIAAGAVISGASPTWASTMATGYAKWELYMDLLPNDTSVVAFCDLLTGSTNVVSIQFYNSGGTYTGIVYWNNFANSSSSFTTNVSADAWMQVECFYDTSPANGSEVLTVKINGTEVVAVTTATFTNKTVNNTSWGVYNGSAGSINTEIVYFDDIVIQDSTAPNNSWVGAEQIAVVVPVGAGDNAADAGTYDDIDEIPPSATATSPGDEIIELDTTTSIGDYTVTAPGTAGITGTVRCVSVLGRVREESAGTSNYTLRVKSASGGSVAASSSLDGGNATVRTNPNSTTAFGAWLYRDTDPTTSAAWTITGTNSLTNMQIGAATTDGAPDIWVLALCAMVGYIPSSGTNMKINIGDNWKTVSGLQINIGDAWKTVSGVKINIGDTWKTVF